MTGVAARSLGGFAAAAICVYLIGLSETRPAGEQPAISVRSFSQGRAEGKVSNLQSRQSVTRDGKETVLVKYRWLDPHHQGITRWKGDLAYLDPKAPKRYLEVALRVDPKRMDEAIESFGVVQSWLRKQRPGRGQDRWIAQAGRRGITLAPQGRQIRVSVAHQWVVRQSAADMRPAAAALRRLWKSKAYFTKRELLAVMASFCQWMEYKVPASERTNEAGETVVTTGVTMPIETLHNGWGDCDSKSLLFASLLANVPKQRVVFLTGSGHLFVGVRATPRKSDHFIELQGAKYILIEMTSPWPIGRVPQKQMAGWRSKNLRVHRIF